MATTVVAKSLLGALWPTMVLVTALFVLFRQTRIPRMCTIIPCFNDKISGKRLTAKMHGKVLQISYYTTAQKLMRWGTVWPQ